MLIQIHPDNPNPRQIKQVIDCLSKGGIIIYPTDTVYGIGCDITKPKAIERIAKLKGLKMNKANFAFICSDLSHLTDYAKQVDNATYKLMKKCLPGPYTFILQATTSVPKLLKNNSKKEVGIRIPNHNIPLEIVNQLGNPILTTSLPDEEEVEYITDPELIHEKYEKLVDIVIDGGIGDYSPSTIIKSTHDEIEVIREGAGEIFW